MELIYGTSNQGKIKEIEMFFKEMQIPVSIHSLKEIGFTQEIEETGTTFEENSNIKAEAIHQFCKQKGISSIIVADDAGLCIDALNGEPGVYSARWAGENKTNEEIIDKLLERMKDIPTEKRTASFVCVLTAILPSGEKIVVRGETKGKVADKIGAKVESLLYNCVFIPDGFDCVRAKLTTEQLGATHREKAFLGLIQKLEEMKK